MTMKIVDLSGAFSCAHCREPLYSIGYGLWETDRVRAAFQCVNERCEKYERVVELHVPFTELEDVPLTKELEDKYWKRGK